MYDNINQTFCMEDTDYEIIKPKVWIIKKFG